MSAQSIVPRCALGVALLFLFGGCQTGLRRLSVEGEVTFQEQPLKHARLEFFHADGTPTGAAAGVLVSGGKYRIPATQGLEPGRYKVLISCTDEVKVLPPGWAGSPPTEELLPAEYSDFDQLKHVVEVSSDGPNVFNFIIP